MKVPPTQERLKHLLRYDPETGFFYWRIDSKRYAAGSKAGRASARRYLDICIDGISYRAHRLAILYVTGDPVPEGIEVDHIDGDRANNTFSNLRVCTRRENGRNVKLHHDNKAGFKGVSFRAGKWEANIKVNYRTIYLGRFGTAEEAHEAYCVAAREHHGEFARAA